MALKRLLNLHEEATHRSLSRACEHNSAHVYTKVRVADVLPIEKSGISDEHYDFALRAHFDFVVCDESQTPLFAVEFDGPTHDTQAQRDRDQKKNWLAARFEMPLLRINARHLGGKYRGMDLLTWFVNAWFALQWFKEAQAKGEISNDEPFSPLFMVHVPGSNKQFPLMLSATARNKMMKLWQKGHIQEYCPTFKTGEDKDGSFRRARSPRPPGGRVRLDSWASLISVSL